MFQLTNWQLLIAYLGFITSFCQGYYDDAVYKYHPKTEQLPPLEFYHQHVISKPPRVSNGTEMPLIYETPDFRIEEDTWYAYTESWFKEENRPYRVSPIYKQAYRWSRTITGWISPAPEYPMQLGCYCTTVYKRLTPLAGCAVLTYRHILTTATSTELVLKNYRDKKHLEHILGAWYETNADAFNVSYYMTPARIHYHPRYLRPHMVNHTHPLPFTFDLAVWTSTLPFYGASLHYIPLASKAVLCQRGGPHWWQYLSSTPRTYDLAHIVGFQFVKSSRKIPMPWYRYVVRTRERLVPCPKTDWGWMHCMPGAAWGRYGIESGAAWHRVLEHRYWLYDGLIGLGAFSMKLRSMDIVHYFTVINTHPVLDFLYDSYMGRLKYEYLDTRFYNTQGGVPVKKRWSYVYDYTYDYPSIQPNNAWLPWY